MEGLKLGADFYLREDVVVQSRDLLGKVLCTQIEGLYTAGIITETEAYAGVTDRASHAYGGRRTARTETMFAGGGLAYIYLCYGIHHLFNVVTAPEGIPHAILIRGIEPLEGIEVMEQRRKMPSSRKGFSDGPGTASSALGLHVKYNGSSLSQNRIWIEDRGISYPDNRIYIGPRIGVAYAKEDALLPYRFLVKK